MIPYILIGILLLPVVFVEGFHHPWATTARESFFPFRRFHDSTFTNHLRHPPVSVAASSPTASPPFVEFKDEAPTSLLDEPDMVAYASAYQTMYQEVPCVMCTAAVGTSLPSDLKGTYYRNGPAMFTAGSLPPPKTSIVQPKQPVASDGQDKTRMVTHPFDADGAVLAVTFHGGDNDGQHVTVRYRYIRTVGFTNERRKGQRLYTGMDSTRRSNTASAATSTHGQPQTHDDTRLANDFPLPLYRHHFLPGLNKLRKNTSNTSVLYWAKKLITLWEGGLPYKLDAVSGSTIGRSQLGGVLKNENIPLGGRYKYDSNTHRMILYSNVLPTPTISPLDLWKQSGTGGIGASSSIITMYEFDESFRLVQQQQSPLTMDNFGLVTDFGITKDFYIIIEPPLRIKNKMSFAVNKDPGSSLVMQDEGMSYIHLIRRQGQQPGEKISCALPNDGISDANIHICNAYQVENSSKSCTVIVDLIRCDSNHVKLSSVPSSWPWATTLDEYSSSTSKKSLWRYTIHVQDHTMSDTKMSIQRECLSNCQLSFGVVNPSFSGQKNSFLYANVARSGLGNNIVSPPQGIVKFDCNQQQIIGYWMPLKHEFCGEPMFAPKSKYQSDEIQKPSKESEDEGYILSVLYNGKTTKSEMVILDSRNISAGPITRIPLGCTVPHGYFGYFVPSDEAAWTYEEIERRAKLADKVESRGNLWNEVKSDFSGLGLRLDDFEEYFGDVL